MVNKTGYNGLFRMIPYRGILSTPLFGFQSCFSPLLLFKPQVPIMRLPRTLKVLAMTGWEKTFGFSIGIWVGRPC